MRARQLVIRFLRYTQQEMALGAGYENLNALPAVQILPGQLNLPAVQ